MIALASDLLSDKYTRFAINIHFNGPTTLVPMGASEIISNMHSFVYKYVCMPASCTVLFSKTEFTHSHSHFTQSLALLLPSTLLFTVPSTTLNNAWARLAELIFNY